MNYDYLVVGAGLYGSILAYRAHQAGKSVVVIDKRPHVGGNLYCEEIEGIQVHKYGPHIFHTSNKKVWDFVNSLCRLIISDTVLLHITKVTYTTCPSISIPSMSFGE